MFKKLFKAFLFILLGIVIIFMGGPVVVKKIHNKVNPYWRTIIAIIAFILITRWVYLKFF